jgi:hypothetical protein
LELRLRLSHTRPQASYSRTCLFPQEHLALLGLLTALDSALSSRDWEVAITHQARTIEDPLVVLEDAAEIATLRGPRTAILFMNL